MNCEDGEYCRLRAILQRRGVRWPDITALLFVMEQSGGNPNGTPIDKAAFYFRWYLADTQTLEREMDIAHGKLCATCEQRIEAT